MFLWQDWAIPGNVWWTEGLDHWKDQQHKSKRNWKRLEVSPGFDSKEWESGTGIETHGREEEENYSCGERVSVLFF